jgi:hypothetical protein
LNNKITWERKVKVRSQARQRRKRKGKIGRRELRLTTLLSKGRHSGVLYKQAPSQGKDCYIYYTHK